MVNLFSFKSAKLVNNCCNHIPLSFSTLKFMADFFVVNVKEASSQVLPFFDFETINMSAWTAFRLGKIEIARALFNKALLVYPANADCLEGLKLCK